MAFIQEPVLGVRQRCGGSPRRFSENLEWSRLTGDSDFHVVYPIMTFSFLRSDAHESDFTGAITPMPNEEQIACHFPKPILLNTVRRGPSSYQGVLFPVLIHLFKGYAHTPYEWSPSTVDIQMFRVGNLVILVIPGELTTMAGRRIRYVRRPGFISRHGSY